MSPLVLGLAVSIAIVAIRLVLIVREFRADSAAAARRALWTLIPFAISFVTAFIMSHLPPLPVDGLGTPQAMSLRFTDCVAGRQGLPIIRGELRDRHLQRASLGGVALIDPIPTGGIGRSDEHVEMYVYPGPTTQHSVQVMFVSIDHVARTAAFGTDERHSLFDVGDPYSIYLNDSVQCVRDRLGEPSTQFLHGVAYNAGPKLQRFYAFRADGRVEWIGYAYGAPIITRPETTALMAPVGLSAFAICMLCLLTTFAGRPVTLMARAFFRRIMHRL